MIGNFGSKKNESKPISATELGQYLRRLANLYSSNRTGKPELSKALSYLADFLIASKAPSIEQAIREKSSSFEKSEINITQSYVDNLTLKHVAKLLENPNCTKSDLIELGLSRFGIPKSRLSRISREKAVEILWSAYRHEQSIDIISDEAKYGGTNRTS